MSQSRSRGSTPVGDNLRLNVTDVGGLIRASCLVSPTPTYRQLDRRTYHWRLISQLSLNHLSLTDPQGFESLRQILRLYNPSDGPENESIIESIQSIRYSRERAITRIRGGLCRGIDVDVTLDPDKLVGSGAFLFAMVLEHFFGLYATINSFTRTNVRLQKSDVMLLTGRPRSGSQLLI